MSKIFQSIAASDGENCSICQQVIRGLKIEYSRGYKTVTLCRKCNEPLDKLQSKLSEAEEMVSMHETEYFKELDRVFEHTTE